MTARARVIAYNTDKLKEQDLPASALALTEPAWKGRVGIAPTNASFVAYVSALIEEIGEPRARQFLAGLQANGAKEYDNNVLILDADRQRRDRRRPRQPLLPLRRVQGAARRPGGQLLPGPGRRR